MEKRLIQVIVEKCVKIIHTCKGISFEWLISNIQKLHAPVLLMMPIATTTTLTNTTVQSAKNLALSKVGRLADISHETGPDS